MTLARAHYMKLSNNKLDFFVDDTRRKDQFVVTINSHGEEKYYAHPYFRYMNELLHGHSVDLINVSSEETFEVHTIVDEENYLTWHGISVYNLRTGFMPDQDKFYEGLTLALDKIHEEQEDEFVRPFRLLSGFGSETWRNPYELADWRQDGWDDAFLAAVADTDLELALYRLEV